MTGENEVRKWLSVDNHKLIVSPFKPSQVCIDGLYGHSVKSPLNRSYTASVLLLEAVCQCP